MEIHYFPDSCLNTIFIQKTYGKLMLVLEFMVLFSLQTNMAAIHFYGQAACLVIGLIFIKVTHLATQSGIGKATQIEFAIKQRNRIRDDHQAKIARILRRAATARVVVQTAVFWSALKAIIAAELQVRSIVKSVLCTVTDTLTPWVATYPPVVCA